MKFLDYGFAHSSLAKIYLPVYTEKDKCNARHGLDRAAALLHDSSAMASAISASAHCLVT